MSAEEHKMQDHGQESPDSNASPRPENEKDVNEARDDVNDEDLSMSHHEYRQIIRKLDWAIIPYCSLLYLLR
jgi:hypothetical protein